MGTRKGKPKKTVARSKKQGKTFGQLKKLKAVVKKQPKNSKAPKKAPKAKGKPKVVGNSLEQLDQESDRLKQKIGRLTVRKAEAHAKEGCDHATPSTVQKLTRQILTLSMKLRSVSIKRYKLRSSSCYSLGQS